MSPETVFPIFMTIWVVLGIAGFLLFHVSSNVRFKKRWFPWFVVLVGVLFIGFVLWMGSPLNTLFLMVPAIVLITFLNIRGTSFCENCGRTIYNQMFFSKTEYCARCGAKLND